MSLLFCMWANQEEEDKNSSDEEKEEGKESDDEKGTDDGEEQKEKAGGSTVVPSVNDGSEITGKASAAVVELSEQQHIVEAEPKRPRPLIGPKSRVKRTEENTSDSISVAVEAAPRMPRPLIGPKSRVRRSEEEDARGSTEDFLVDKNADKAHDPGPVGFELTEKQQDVEDASSRRRPVIGPKSRVRRLEEEELGGAALAPFVDETSHALEQEHSSTSEETQEPRSRPRIGPKSRVKRVEEEGECAGDAASLVVSGMSQDGLSRSSYFSLKHGNKSSIAFLFIKYVFRDCLMR
jgi:hypothetical protein